MAEFDIFIFAAGVLRVLAYAFGAWYGWYSRHWVTLAAFVSATISGCVFLFFNAGVNVPPYLFSFAAYWTTPVAVGLVAAVVFCSESLPDPASRGKRKWRP